MNRPTEEHDMTISDPAGSVADEPTSRPRGRHPVNVGHLVMGLAFLGLVGVWALITSDTVDGEDVRWLLPVPWVLAGVAGLLATTLSGRRDRPDRHGPAPISTTDPYDQTPEETR